MGEKRLIIGAAVNDEAVLAGNLAASPLVADGGAELLVERGRPSAAIAYNAILDRAGASGADVVVFAHQDVYLPRGWKRRLLATVDDLEQRGVDWGVLGVIGRQHGGRFVGRLWCSGNGGQIAGRVSASPQPVETIDELIIVVRQGASLRFDENLPGFHMYGTDVIQIAQRMGLGAYVFDGPVVHNSRQIIHLKAAYYRAYLYMQRKYWSDLPLFTCVVPVTRSGWPLLRRTACFLKRSVLRQIPQQERHPQPMLLARQLGYEAPLSLISPMRSAGDASEADLR